MPSLLPLLRAEAERRGLLAPDEQLDAARAFALVREMTYTRASSREPEATIAEWRGTCAGKHYLLRALLEELGHRTILMACTGELSKEDAPGLPPELLAMLDQGPILDVHNFLRVELDGEWMTVDATWPLAARESGLPVNGQWVPGRDMRTALDPIEVFHVPDDVDPQEFKRRLIERELGDQGERRERFIEGLSAWAASLADEPAPRRGVRSSGSGDRSGCGC